MRLACVLLAGLSLCCDRAADAIPLPLPGKAADKEPAELFVRSRPLMGTVFVVNVDADPKDAEPAVQAAFDEIERLENALSEWREGSEISAINRAAGKRPVKVSDDVYTVIKAGLDVSRWSRGAFDLSWAALRGQYDFTPGAIRIPTKKALRKKLPLIDWTKIRVNDSNKTVFLRKRGMAIGTGAIAKGYALDRAGVVLRQQGIDNYMLFGGGQVQVRGLRDGRPWRVGIQHPRDESMHFASLESRGASFSTSGDYENAYIDRAGRRWHHIIDPKTGQPADESMSVTVMASSGIYADALSTAAFVLGPEDAQKLLSRLPVRADVVIVGRDCVLRATKDATKHLRPNDALGDRVGAGKPLPNCKPAAR